VSFALVFSTGYSNQYPAEKTNPSSFACDTTIRNAQFDTNLLSLAIPLSEEEQIMFDLLNNQQLELHIDLLNTLVKCASLSTSQVLGGGISTSTIAMTSCVDDPNGTLSAIITLPYQGMTVQLVIADIQLIGAVRIGLSGNGVESEYHVLRDLNFRQTFSVNDGTLAQTGTINLQLTKAINETESMNGNDESEFEGIWYPTFSVDKNQMFLSEEEYMTTTSLSKTTLLIIMSETPFYIKNHQAPIAKRPEIIFHDLLFTIVCLDIFGLVFLIFKLILIPLFEFLLNRGKNHQNGRVQPRNSRDDDHEMKET
jgi:hypothetical protein